MPFLYYAFYHEKIEEKGVGQNPEVMTKLYEVS